MSYEVDWSERWAEIRRRPAPAILKHIAEALENAGLGDLFYQHALVLRLIADTYPTPVTVTLEETDSDPHHFGLVRLDGEVPRYRAYCSCGWVSLVDDVHIVREEWYAEHRRRIEGALLGGWYASRRSHDDAAT